MTKRYPQPGVGIAVFDGTGRVVLVRRGKGVYRDLWSLPGGRQEWGERMEEAARRELKEETGLTAHALMRSGYLEPIVRGSDGAVKAHYLLTVFACTRFEGTLVAGDDAAQAAWATREEMLRLHTTPHLEQAITQAARLCHTAF